MVVERLPIPSPPQTASLPRTTFQLPTENVDMYEIFIGNCLLEPLLVQGGQHEQDYQEQARVVV